MPVKIDPEIVEELAAMDLVIWEAMYQKQDVLNEKTGKFSKRENKNWVFCTLAGPGTPEHCIGSGKTLREAVDSVLTKWFADRVPGIRGAMMRLDRELLGLMLDTMEYRYKIAPSTIIYDDDIDDDVPF